jgi:arylsulfatase
MNRPNVLVILADDLGYSDLGVFGGEIETPNLDRLAGRGTRMTSFYVTPRCSPSRAALLTGRHPHSVGIGILTGDDRPRGYVGSLSASAPTLAERLGAEGYATCLSGKWHLSADTATPNETWPTRRGFEEFYGILPGCGSYYQPRLMTGEEQVSSKVYQGDYYFTDDISAYASDFIERAHSRATPLFLYLAYTAPHWPLHAREKDIAKYRERFAAGWDRLRQERFERQKGLDLHSAAELSPRDPEVPAWDDTPDQEWEIERMATYAAQVEVMDRGIGDVLRTLERLGQLEDTLILFSSDNGACAEPLPPTSAGKKFNPEICPPETRDGTPVRVGNNPSIKPGPEEGYASYGRAWANLSNTPFRLYKRWVHEGGISSSFIASWPAGGVNGGEISTHPGHLVDIVPTVMDAVGGASDGPGVSLLDQWRNPSASSDLDERPLFWEHIGNAAVRRGDWKLVRENGSPWELYDISADRGETNNRAAAEPELVQELTTLWHNWARSNGVIPWDAVLADYRDRGIPEQQAAG